MLPPVSFEQDDLERTHDLLLPGICADMVATVRKGMALAVGVFIVIFVYAVVSDLSHAQGGWNPPGHGANPGVNLEGDCDGRAKGGGATLGTYDLDGISNYYLRPAYGVNLHRDRQNTWVTWRYIENPWPGQAGTWVKQMIQVVRWDFERTGRAPRGRLGTWSFTKTCKFFVSPY